MSLPSSAGQRPFGPPAHSKDGSRTGQPFNRARSSSLWFGDHLLGQVAQQKDAACQQQEEVGPARLERSTQDLCIA